MMKEQLTLMSFLILKRRNKMKKSFLIIASILCICVVAFAYTEINFNNRWASGTYRVDSDVDGKLRASAITYVLISTGVDDNEEAGWAWFAGADTSYNGSLDHYGGDYSIRVKTKSFVRQRAGTYEGRAEADQYEHLHLSIHPPPQNGDGPDIADCEAEAGIDGTHPVTGTENEAYVSIP